MKSDEHTKEENVHKFGWRRLSGLARRITGVKTDVSVPSIATEAQIPPLSLSIATRDNAAQSGEFDAVFDVLQEEYPYSAPTSDTAQQRQPVQLADCFIEQLPNELLSVIFQLAHASPVVKIISPQVIAEARWERFHGTDRLNDVLLPPRTIPKIVTLVSHRWREIAFSIPSLWGSLHIAPSRDLSLEIGPTVHADLRPVAEGLLDWVDAYLIRSRDHPLDIYLDCSWTFPREVVNKLLPHSHRWRSLTIGTNYPKSYAAVLLALRQISVPNLEKLELWMAHPPNVASLPLASRFHLFNGNTPKLHYLKLDHFDILWTCFSLTNVSTLDLRAAAWPSYADLRAAAWPSYADLKSTFGQLTLLQSLTIHTDFLLMFLNVNPVFNDAIELPSLRNLTLRDLGLSREGAHFALVVSTPALENLTLENIQPASCVRYFSQLYWSYARSSFAQRQRVGDGNGQRPPAKSYPSLRRLTLVDVYESITGRFMQDMDITFPQLAHLGLVNVHTTNSVLRHLANRHSRLLVGLQTLGVAQWNLINGSTLLRVFLAAREAMGLPLGSLVLDDFFWLDGERIKRLKQLVKVEKLVAAE